MQESSLDDIPWRVDACANLIGAPAGVLPTYGRTEDGARPHLEVDGLLMHYAVVERGQELLRETFTDAEELIGRVFESVAFQMAADFEVRNRRVNEGFRRQLFAKQLEHLGALNPRWAQRRRAHLETLLREHPFCDDLEARGF